MQENKAEKSLEALQQWPRQHQSIPDRNHSGNSGTDLVRRPCCSGNRRLSPPICALPRAANLKVMESMLTGESAPVEKKAEIMIGAGPPRSAEHGLWGQLWSMGVARDWSWNRAGQPVGQIAAFIQSRKEEVSPLQKRLEALGKTLGGLVIVTCIAMFLTGIAYGRETFGMLLTAVSLAVAAVPEGLPAIATVVLALGVRRMALRKAIIKKLPAVETLGNTTVICSDKTGTLTKNKMTVQKIFSAGRVSPIAEALAGNDFHQLVQTGVLCNDAQIVAENNRSKNSPPAVSGDPTETALVELGLRAGLHKKPLESLTGIWRSL